MMCARLWLFTGYCVVWLIDKAAGDCLLPPHPSHGRHQPQGGDCGGANKHPACDGTPGTLAPEDWLLTIQCDPGYRHSNPSLADVPSVCSQGTWSIPTLPPCVIPNLVGDDQDRCIVQEPPPNTQYRPLAEECGADSFSPGSVVPHDCILFLNCAPGYRRRVGTGDSVTFCTNKTWTPTIPNDFCIKESAGETTPPTSPVVQSTGCVLPNTSPTRKFCSLTPGCENCDFYNTRCHAPSGSRLDKVKVVCDQSYTVVSNDIAICLPSGWYPSIPKCIKVCPPLKSEQLRLMCRFGTDPISCSKPALPNTTVVFECLPGFTEIQQLQDNGAYKITIICGRSGEWSDNLPQCIPVCGVSKEAQKFGPTIVEGINATVGFFPWHAGLYISKVYNGRTSWVQSCGGSLLNNRVVITAAHCLYKVQDINDLRVALGKYYRSWDIQEPTEEKRNVSAITMPQDYNPNIFSFDVALVLLSERIKFGEYIMPVCYDRREGTGSHGLLNSNLYVVGWGKVGPGGPSSQNLLYNTVNILSDQECKKKLPSYYTASEKLCVFKSDSESTTQEGDSGGGLTAQYGDKRHYLVGIVSSKIGTTSLFTNIRWRTHLDWIAYTLTQFKINYGD